MPEQWKDEWGNWLAQEEIEAGLARQRAIKALEPLNLSNRARNCLVKAGFSTIDEVVTYIREDAERLLGVTGIGVPTLNEIEKSIAAHLSAHPEIETSDEQAYFSQFYA